MNLIPTFLLPQSPDPEEQAPGGAPVDLDPSFEATCDQSFQELARTPTERAKVEAETLIATYRAEREKIKAEIQSDEELILKAENALSNKRTQVGGKWARIDEIDSVISVFETVAAGFDQQTEFQAKASEDNGATGEATMRPADSMTGEASRVDAGRTASATSERMDATAGRDRHRKTVKPRRKPSALQPA